MTAYYVRSRDWISDVCSSYLTAAASAAGSAPGRQCRAGGGDDPPSKRRQRSSLRASRRAGLDGVARPHAAARARAFVRPLAERIGTLAGRRPQLRRRAGGRRRSDAHTSELQSPLRISYTVFCLKIQNYISQNRIKNPSYNTQTC